MLSPQLAFQLLVFKIRQHRPRVADALECHRADLMIVANQGAPDAHRIAALRRAGAATIRRALKEKWPAGSSFAEQRLRADLRLLHAALALANDLERPEWYRELALATAHGIGLVIASGLYGEQSPGGLDLYIWRACGTRSFEGSCDDALCRLCWEHDRARGAIQAAEAAESRQNWETGLAVAGVALLTVGVVGVVATALSRR